MDGQASAPDPERELSDLRARSYGTDIQDDPEVPPAEAAGRGPPASAIERRLRSLWRRGTSTRPRRVALAAGGLVGAGAILATVVLVFWPRPDATLHRTTAEADARVVRLATGGWALWREIDGSTLRSYGSYLGLELWSAQNAFGSTCLLAVQPSIGILSEVDCAPPPADVFIDVSSWGDEFGGFPGEGIIRFWLRGDTVDAYLYYLPSAD